MKIDIKKVLGDVVEFFKASAGDQWEALRPQALEYVTETEKRLLRLSLESTTGQLSPEFLAAKAKEELGILESQAISLGIISAAMSQEVINQTVFNVLFVVINALTKKLNENQ